MPDDAPDLIYDRQGHTVVLTMNRPARRNALSLDMLVRFADAWDAIDADDSIRSVILTGAEGSYCVGGDLDSGWMAGNRSANPSENETRAMDNPALIGRGLLLSSWLHTPIIAVVNGDCMGGGCEMLQQTDIRVAEEQARFAVPEARRGLHDALEAADPLCRRDGDASHRAHPGRRRGLAMGIGDARRPQGGGTRERP